MYTTIEAALRVTEMAGGRFKIGRIDGRVEVCVSQGGWVGVGGGVTAQ